MKIGILGAARIAPFALIAPAREQGHAVFVAARDPARARAFSRKHRIGMFDSYDAMLASDIDAVYNPLPNALHAEWTEKALRAGKHVLCEKPFTSNAAEAEHIATLKTDRVVMEAFHWRYHPMADAMKAAIPGRIRHIDVKMRFPLPGKNDIRYNLKLGGGTMMDCGCYTVAIMRHLAGEEPEVTSAQALLKSPGIDRAMKARFKFASGATGAIHASLWSWTWPTLSARVETDNGVMTVFNPVAPQYFGRLKVNGKRVPVAKGNSYGDQLKAFVAAVEHGAPFPTGVEHAIANMRVIDRVYLAAGLAPR